MTDKLYHKLLCLSEKTEHTEDNPWTICWNIPGYPSIWWNKRSNEWFSADMLCSGATVKEVLERYEALDD